MRKGSSSLRGRAAVLTLALLAAATAQAEEWFDAYQLGMDALRQRKAARAAELFERAIRLRPEPGANLITYGTNRLDRYQPYLRLAEARLLAGQPEQAREALQRSQARGKEPAAERARLAAQVEQALALSRATAATPAPPPPSTLAAPPSTPTAVPVAPLTTGPSLQPSAAVAPAPTVRPTEPPRAVARATPAPSPPRALAAGPSETPAPVPSPASALGSILVVSEPGGAAVYLDDEAVGETDPRSGRLVKTGLAPGGHRLRIARAGYEDSVQEVAVEEGRAATLHAALVPAQRWTGAAAIAATLAVLALLAAAWVWRRRAAPVADGRTVTVSGRVPAADRTRPTVPRPTPGRAATAVGETAALPLAGSTAAAATQFGDYVLLEVLGKGGMATVFKARRGAEMFALKRPLAAYLDEPEFLERFLREAEIGRTLHHPNIIRIHERGEVDGVPYFTMELVEGETLAAGVRRDGALTPRAAARLVAQVAEALDYAHLKGVVHRDLKPSNIMVLVDGTAKVMDYGIARARRFEGLTVTGAFLGTPDYVAPETAEGKGADARSDLYSLGVVFYEVVTGKKPFVGDTPFATLRKHCTEPPTPPSTLSPGLPREVEAIILRLLCKDPGERYPGAEELLIELRDYLNRAG